MRKEQLVAIILGSAIGVGVAFGLWKFSRSGKMPTTKQVNSVSQNTSTHGSPETTNEFAIVTPADFSVIRDGSATITGLANSNAVIVAQADEVSFAKANSSGEFSLELPLSSGLNKISVFSFEKGQPAKKLTLTLIHSTALPGSADTAYTSLLGTITDVTDDNLQIRGDNGEIKQLAITSDTTFVKIIDDADEIEFSDIAIGDYIAALGTLNSNVMSVSRILVTTAPDESEITSVSGTIETLSSSEFLVKSHETGESVSIDATKGAKTYSAKEDEISSSRLSTADEGDEIIIIGEMHSQELVADTLILL